MYAILLLSIDTHEIIEIGLRVSERKMIFKNLNDIFPFDIDCYTTPLGS